MMDGGRVQGNLCCEEGRKLIKKEEGRKFRLGILLCLEIHNPSLLF